MTSARTPQNLPPHTQQPAQRSQAAQRPRPQGTVLERSGMLVVDKPAGWTSHDVVSKLRGIMGTRRVGHSGTLDPMATGVLVVGVERGTKFLAHVVDHEKRYQTTFLLGASTLTDDAEGDVTHISSTDALEALTPDSIREAIQSQVGVLMQTPARVSSVKINGRRAHELVREGIDFEIPAREVEIYSIDIENIRRVDGDSDLKTLPESASDSVKDFSVHPPAELWEVTMSVHSTAGTYVRSLARDVGVILGTGGFLTALRRTTAGPFDIAEAKTLEELQERPELALTLDEAMVRCFPVRDITEAQGVDLGMGKWLAPIGQKTVSAAVTPDGKAIALVKEEGKRAKSVFVARPDGMV